MGIYFSLIVLDSCVYILIIINFFLGCCELLLIIFWSLQSVVCCYGLLQIAVSRFLLFLVQIEVGIKCFG